MEALSDPKGNPRVVSYVHNIKMLRGVQRTLARLISLYRTLQVAIQRCNTFLQWACAVVLRTCAAAEQYAAHTPTPTQLTL